MFPPFRISPVIDDIPGSIPRPGGHRAAEDIDKVAEPVNNISRFHMNHPVIGVGQIGHEVQNLSGTIRLLYAEGGISTICPSPRAKFPSSKGM
jgi:hypothetical protein